MADQGKWWKLWCASLRDDDLENLSIHDWFGWVRFGAHVKENGKTGKIRLRAPATAVVNLLRVTAFNDAIDMIKRFPNYEVKEEENVTVSKQEIVSVKCKNWNKYQGDWSRDRVRKHRKNVTTNVTAQEEKRREEKRSRREVERNTSLAQGAKEYPLPDPKTNPKACLVLTYKARKGLPYDDRAWDKTNFGRAMAAATTLLALCKDLGSARDCLNDMAEEYEAKNLTWTLETIARNAGEWLQKNGRINANAARAGLRMAIAERKGKTDAGKGLAHVSAREIFNSVGVDDNSKKRDESSSQ